MPLYHFSYIHIMVFRSTLFVQKLFAIIWYYMHDRLYVIFGDAVPHESTPGYDTDEDRFFVVIYIYIYMYAYIKYRNILHYYTLCIAMVLFGQHLVSCLVGRINLLTKIYL